MNVILLSGGSGTRLWPLSNEVRSKQFLKVFKTENGYESMLQRMYRMIRAVDPQAGVTIATSARQAAQIRVQLGNKVSVSIEPCRRDTFPAIALSCAYLASRGVAEDAPVVVCPVDPWVDERYFECMKALSDAAEAGKYRLTLMGIEPKAPSERYGYILPDGDRVRTFREKPDVETAKKYIAEGALWNGGVFAFRLGYLLEIAKRELGTADYVQLYENYANLRRISFDYAVAEKEPEIGVIRYCGKWSDLGTWDSLTEAIDEPVCGNAFAADCRETHVVNELEIPVIALGLEHAVVAATAGGILVADKRRCGGLKECVAQAQQAGLREEDETRDVCFQPLSEGKYSVTRHLVIAAGGSLEAQAHRHRAKLWIVADGAGSVIIGEETRSVRVGDSVRIPQNMPHTLRAETELHILEVQIDDEMSEEFQV